MYISYGKLSSQYYTNSKPISKSIMGDIEYYISRLQDTRGLVLEAGVGTGRVLIPLLENKIEIEGIDSSKDMLEICEKELEIRGLNTNLYNKDLLDLDFMDKYETIIMPTGSFMLIEDYEKLLNNFYKALKENGRLIIDISSPVDFIEGEIYTDILQINNNEGIILETRNISIDYIKQYTKSILKYEKYINGNLKETELQEFILYYYGVREFS
ncbi:MAG TPA: class I SAM-dependent methyltransferase, partial [Tissierellaceae bacterium]